MGLVSTPNDLNSRSTNYTKDPDLILITYIFVVRAEPLSPFVTAGLAWLLG